MSDVTQQVDLNKVSAAEFTGKVSSTLRYQSQSDFALLLSMMQQDITERLKLAEEKEEPKVLGSIAIEDLNFYPKIPLSAAAEHYQTQSLFASAISQNDLATSHLLACMHPTPLSLHNDHMKVPDEVLANCDLYTQARYHKQVEADVEVDPTLMFETISDVHDRGLA